MNILTPIAKLGELLLNRAVLYGFLCAVLIFSSFRLGSIQGSTLYLKKAAALREVAPITITDRNGVILYKTTAGKYLAHLTPSEEYKRAPSFVDYTLNKVKEQYGEGVIENGVYVRTTIDLKLQNTAQAAILEHMLGNTMTTDGSMIVADSYTGDILAFVSSIHYYDQPGSSIQSSLSGVDKKNPFISIIDSSGKFVYRNRHAHEDSPINEDELISSVQWSPDENTVITN